MPSGCRLPRLDITWIIKCLSVYLVLRELTRFEYIVSNRFESYLELEVRNMNLSRFEMRKNYIFILSLICTFF